MLNANIMNESNTIRVQPRLYQTLTKQQRVALRKKTIGHGNMRACEQATGKDRGMILRAINGYRLLPENAELLINYLQSS